MKKSLLVILAILWVFLSGPSAIKAAVPGSSLDQAYEATAGGYGFLIDNNANMIQTFKPTKNRLASIDVYLKDRQPGSTITLKIIEMQGQEGPATANVLTTSSHELSGPAGTNWETFSFTEPFVTVNPGTYYGIKLSIGEMQTRWYYNNTGFEAGAFLATSAPHTWDACFRVYSFDYLSPSASPTATSSTSTPTSEASNSQSQGETKSKLLTIDKKIAKPVLTEIQKNGQKLASIPTKLNLVSSDELTLVGTSFSGAKVVVLVGDQISESAIDSSGNWTAKIKMNAYQNGEYTVYGQAQKDNKGSEKANFLKVKVGPVASQDSSASSLFSWKEAWYWPTILFTIVLIAGIVIIILLRKHFAKKSKEEIAQLGVWGKNVF